MIKNLIKFAPDMGQVIHGVNSQNNRFLISNYSLTKQIIIINFSTAFIALVFLIIFNLFLITSNQNLENQKNLIEKRLNIISEYLIKNAIKRPYSFNDSCSGAFVEKNVDCRLNDVLNKNIQDNPPELDPTFTQKYIFSNFLDSNIIIRVFADNLIKYVDTEDIYSTGEEIIISDIKNFEKKTNKEKINLYDYYKNFYFNRYNHINKFLTINKFLSQNQLKNTKNETLIAIETIKAQNTTFFMFKDENDEVLINFSRPVKKNNKIFGVVSINALLTFDDNISASKSLLLTNFFLFFLSIMSFLSLLFSKSIVNPIKVLSKNTQLERDKSNIGNNEIIYPNRKDEIGALSKDIQIMSNDLKKRIKEIEEFASDVSHELKNPLASLKSSSELLMNNKLEEKNKEILIKNIDIDIDRMNILISEIANYTLTGVEISEQIFEEVELLDLIDNFKKNLSYDNFQLEIHSNEKKIFLKINKNKFIQVIHNLLDNALTYIPINSKILIFVKVVNQQCIIHFADQGPGISLDYKDKIFDRFYTDREKNRKSHSGLGLSISKKIIESFGGDINLINSAHLGFEGACFEIKLPLKEL